MPCFPRLASSSARIASGCKDREYCKPRKQQQQQRQECNNPRDGGHPPIAQKRQQHRDGNDEQQ